MGAEHDRTGKALVTTASTERVAKSFTKKPPTRTPAQACARARASLNDSLDANDDEPSDEDLFALPSSISFFAEGPDADEKVCDAIWNMFVKDSNGRGFDARSKQSRTASITSLSSPLRRVANAEAKLLLGARRAAGGSK